MCQYWRLSSKPTAPELTPLPDLESSTGGPGGPSHSDCDGRSLARRRRLHLPWQRLVALLLNEAIDVELVFLRSCRGEQPRWHRRGCGFRHRRGRRLLPRWSAQCDHGGLRCIAGSDRRWWEGQLGGRSGQRRGCMHLPAGRWCSSRLARALLSEHLLEHLDATQILGVELLAALEPLFQRRHLFLQVLLQPRIHLERLELASQEVERNAPLPTRRPGSTHARRRSRRGGAASRWPVEGIGLHFVVSVTWFLTMQDYATSFS